MSSFLIGLFFDCRIAGGCCCYLCDRPTYLLDSAGLIYCLRHCRVLLSHAVLVPVVWNLKVDRLDFFCCIVISTVLCSVAVILHFEHSTHRLSLEAKVIGSALRKINFYKSILPLWNVHGSPISLVPRPLFLCGGGEKNFFSLFPDPFFLRPHTMKKVVWARD